MKKCFKCGENKLIDEFYRHKEMPDGHLGKCKDCTKIDVSLNYQLKRDGYKKYEKKRQKSINRILSHRYSGIKSRVEGRATRRYYVEGKPMLTKQEFYSWYKDRETEFMEIYKIWESNDYKNKFAPSIDRIDNKKGYTVDNMRWVTKSFNSSKGAK